MFTRIAARLALFSFSLALAQLACARADIPLSPTPSQTSTYATRLAQAAAPTPARLTPTLMALPIETALPLPTTPPSPLEPVASPTPETAATAVASHPAAATPTVPMLDEQRLRIPAAAYTASALALLPARLVIPKLNLDQEIVKVSALNGEWDMSHLGHYVGWLETTGQNPSDSLAMVLAGHLTVTSADMGPFANLWKLHVGDEVIYRAGGTDYVYAVKHRIDADPSETWRLYVKDKHQLLLVTCAEWDYLAWKYGKRLIVVTEATEQRPSP